MNKLNNLKKDHRKGMIKFHLEITFPRHCIYFYPLETFFKNK
jgi:hypothetical protein